MPAMTVAPITASAGQLSDGDRSWSDPSLIELDDGQDAITGSMVNGQRSFTLFCGFDFSFLEKADVVTGMTVFIKGRSALEQNARYSQVQWNINGALTGLNLGNNTAMGSSTVTRSFGGVTDLWGDPYDGGLEVGGLVNGSPLIYIVCDVPASDPGSNARIDYVSCSVVWDEWPNDVTYARYGYWAHARKFEVV